MKSIRTIIVLMLVAMVWLSGKSQGTVVYEYPAMLALEKPWDVSVYGGLGYQSPLGKLHDNFGGAMMFQVGVTAGYKRLRGKLEVAYSQPSLRNKNIFNVPDSIGLDGNRFPKQGNSNASATHLLGNFQLGYTVWRNEKLEITPNAGVHYNSYRWDVENYSWSKADSEVYTRHILNAERRTLTSWSWIASVDVDLKLSTHTTLGDMSSKSSWLRFTAWVSGSNFTKCDPSVKGCNIGLTANYMFRM